MVYKFFDRQRKKSTNSVTITRLFDTAKEKFYLLDVHTELSSVSFSYIIKNYTIKYKNTA